MTKKDYILIAGVINRVAEGAQDSYLIRLDSLIGEFKWALARDNPNFDKEKFEAACLKH